MLITMSKDPSELYQAIGQTLSKAAPPGWSEIEAKITLEGLMVDAVVSYVTLPSGASGHLTGIPRLARHFYDLARVVSSEENGLFKKCVFKLQSDGKFDVKFTY